MTDVLNNDIEEISSDTEDLLDKLNNLNERVDHLIAASKYPECEYELNDFRCRLAAGIDALVDLHNFLIK